MKSFSVPPWQLVLWRGEVLMSNWSGMDVPGVCTAGEGG